MMGTTVKDIIRREFDVAFSRHSQPLWFRITKWCVILTVAYVFRRSEYLIPFTIIVFLFAIALHFFWRYKTKGWTRSWFGWDAEKNRTKHQHQ